MKKEKGVKCNFTRLVKGEGEGRDKKKGSLAGFLILLWRDRLHLSYFSSISASTPRSSAGTG